LDGFAPAWERSVISTGPVDRAAAEGIVREVYREAGLSPPEIVWSPSPSAFVDFVAATEDHENPGLGRAATGNKRHPELFELLFVGRLASPPTLLGAIASAERIWPQQSEPFPFDEAVEAVAAGASTATLAALITQVPRFHFRARTAVLLEPPLELHLDEAGSLHSLDGPAIRFPDQTEAWAIHGIFVDRDVVEAPERLNPLRALAHPNAEVRRTLIERIGYDRIGGAAARAVFLSPTAEDNTGKLWHLPSQDPEPLALVEVENATLEPDGTRKRYFLRVPPTCRTAREAVAWTFGLDLLDYAPEAQS
jgi:hypothetical protein